MPLTEGHNFYSAICLSQHLFFDPALVKNEMIVAIDHLAFASDCIEKDVDVFRDFGYRSKYEENNLWDLQNKRPFMDRYSGRLDIAFLTCPGSLSVELLDHGHTVNKESFLYPVFEDVSHKIEKLDESFVADMTFCKVRSKQLQAEFFVPMAPLSGESNCRKVIVDAQDVEQSAAFWKNLGFNIVCAGDGFAKMSFDSPLNGITCEMYVRKNSNSPGHFLLDARGFNCIAFLSSDAEEERRVFEDSGIEATTTNHFHVNGNDFSIYWLQGPGDELVEIIGLA